MLEREVHALLHMRDDDQRTHRRREIVMRISLEAHVLREVLRFHEFADVVKVRADTAKGRVCTDSFGSGFRQIGYDKAMVICTRRFDGHPAQQRMIEIGSFQPRNVSGDSKQILKHWQRTAYYGCGDDSVADAERALHSEHAPVVSRRIKPVNWPNQTERQRQQPDSQANTKSGADQV